MPLHEQNATFPGKINPVSDDSPDPHTGGNIIVIKPEPHSDSIQLDQTPDINAIKHESNPDISEQYQCETKVKPENDSVASSDIKSEVNMFFVKTEQEVIYSDQNFDLKEENISIKCEDYKIPPEKDIKSE